MPGDAVTTPQIELVRALFCRAGLVREITEDQVHAVIGAAGSASAFVFYAIEAMIDEAVRQGLKRPLATQLVEQTVRGAATMLIESGEHPAIARGGVTSPGGTTAQGIAALDKAGVRAGLAAAMDAATASSRELSGE
jgi:pyrroline-5-carboxylate reductase